jgi:hypothetical protein
LQTTHGEDADLVFVLVAGQADLYRSEQPGHLDDGGVEHLGRSRPFGDERRHPAKRRLLVRELSELVSACGARERCGDQLREQPPQWSSLGK